MDLDFLREREAPALRKQRAIGAGSRVPFKLRLIGYRFGIRSDRQLMRELHCNPAYPWYLRLKLTDHDAENCPCGASELW